jgi:hypothetical protein
MRELFNHLYEFLHDSQSPVYEDKVYFTVGIWLILTTLLIGVIFYCVVNRLRAKYYKRWPHWGGCLILNMVIGFLVPIIIVHSLGDDQIGAFSPDTLLLSLINMLYAAVFFFLASMVLKWFSLSAKYTPF